ncbi:copper oxidase [Arthrobacter sp. Soil782]|uniref:multicopper oxidase domain-containing protein n=1 Tax=Arthrobacter sp. Soil782 TaxID=1736410 RepID=UPI0006F7E0DD|nr:multicopper oxidase domain-containing protein [Arthrobacter sp. Soil782]KRF09208.1 copper oxidase [Arthrobacter sp. Soil782]
MRTTTTDRPPAARASWHRKASRPVLVWFVLLLVLALVHRWVPESRWLLVHMFVLGMVTNSILVWSQHFAEALLKNRLGEEHRNIQVLRIRLLNLGIAATVAGVLTGIWALTLVGAVVIGAMVTWHAVSLMQQLRTALPSRFGSTIKYYIAAALLLPVGAAFGAVLAYGLDERAHARFLLAHQALNVLGFVGLTVIGTLVTLWPTMLRTRMVDGLARAGRWGLAAMLAGTLLTTVGALGGWAIPTALGVLVYLDGVVITGFYFVKCALQKRPNDYSTFSVAAGLLWLTGSLLGLFLLIVTGPADPERLHLLTVPVVAGFAAQVLLGAMSFLMPTVMGGGPVAVRNALQETNRFAMLRIAVINFGLLIFLFSEASWVRVITSALVLAAYVSFLPLMLRAVRVSVAARKATLRDQDGSNGLRRPVRVTIEPTPAPQRHLAGAAAGIVIVLAGAGAGIMLDPAAVGLNLAQRAGTAEVEATGEETRVKVSARDMQFHPASVDVPAGNTLLIELSNDDPTTVHDLALETGERSERLRPGETAILDAGLIAAGTDGWCTVVGHRSMGMVFKVNVIGGPSDDPAAAAGVNHGGESNHGGHGGSGGTGGPLNLSEDSGPGFVAREAALQPAPAGTVHRFTFEITQEQRAIAPGVLQEAWTYNGQVNGPTLRGRVGDTFEITLVNNGSIGHSIDVHAGAVSPEEVMRSIPPGESLVYRFRAERSGIWLYHCATAPVSAHIASGMFGAVIIDPPNLPPADREYLLVQSEAYLEDGSGAVDVRAIAAGQPDAVMWNGHANQYMFQPLQAESGERVRVWVMAAGPSRGTSFHIVGDQFDTVFKEGAYLLRKDNPEQGGAQSLDLAPAQGGFVELQFDQPGNYMFLNHSLADAERGAQGMIAVTDAP